MTNKQATLTRRGFLRAAGTSVAAFPSCRHVLAGGATPPVRIEYRRIGVGGQGAGDIGAVAGNNIVALCDADERRPPHRSKIPDAKRFRISEGCSTMEKSIDAVVVATPDHTTRLRRWRPSSAASMSIARNPWPIPYEVRQLMKAAQEHKVVTQLGNQVTVRYHPQLLRVDLGWRHRQRAYHPRGLFRCKFRTDGCRGSKSNTRFLRLSIGTLAWAAARPAISSRLSARKLARVVPFGNGTIGDWTCHVVDPVFGRSTWCAEDGFGKVKDYDPNAV